MLHSWTFVSYWKSHVYNHELCVTRCEDKNFFLRIWIFSEIFWGWLFCRLNLVRNVYAMIATLNSIAFKWPVYTDISSLLLRTLIALWESGLGCHVCTFRALVQLECLFQYVPLLDLHRPIQIFLKIHVLHNRLHFRVPLHIFHSSKSRLII